MKRFFLVFCLSTCFVTVQACDRTGDDPKPEPQPVLYASKPLNQCEQLSNDWMHPYTYSNYNYKISTYGADKKEGKFCYMINYGFDGTGVYESVYFRHDWDTWRTDLSFEPIGISFWFKGTAGNAGRLRVVLVTDTQLTPGSQISREEYECFNDTALQNGEWQNLLFQYKDFKPTKAYYGDLQLDKVIAYRIEFVNSGNVARKNNYAFIDDIRQQTAFDSETKMNKDAKFSSIFIQLAHDYIAKTVDNWESSFRDLQSVGINEMIVQFCVNSKPSYKCWYANTSLTWAEQGDPIIDNMVAAAEKCNFNLVFGLYGGGYGETNTELISKNKDVIDEVFGKFGSSSCFSGWYIAQEFYDSTWERNWLRNETLRDDLADYNQTIAAYCKSKKNKPVMIAPALWRGMPAKMCGDWFDKIFARTPDVDILYLQDCGGRGNLEVTCPIVDLPNWYQYIKAACDKNGVKFGVDLESFKATDGGGSLPREWDYMKYQLYIAGMFTDYITNFSWISFRPGDANFEAYRNSITK